MDEEEEESPFDPKRRKQGQTSGEEVVGKKPPIIFNNVQLETALSKFREVSEKQLKNLTKIEGLDLQMAIDTLVDKLRSEESIRPFEPKQEDIELVMGLAEFTKEDAIRALIVREELVKLRQKGFQAHEAVDKLIDRMKILVGSKRKVVSGHSIGSLIGDMNNIRDENSPREECDSSANSNEENFKKKPRSDVFIWNNGETLPGVDEGSRGKNFDENKFSSQEVVSNVNNNNNHSAVDAKHPRNTPFEYLSRFENISISSPRRSQNTDPEPKLSSQNGQIEEQNSLGDISEIHSFNNLINTSDSLINNIDNNHSPTQATVENHLENSTEANNSTTTRGVQLDSTNNTDTENQNSNSTNVNVLNDATTRQKKRNCPFSSEIPFKKFHAQ